MRALAILAAFCWSGVAAASTVIPMSLDELADSAGVIFAGTVTDLQYVKLPEAGLVTKVSFGQLSYASSPERGDRLTLVVRGGIDGNRIGRASCRERVYDDV